MKKLGIITLCVFALAAFAAAGGSSPKKSKLHQCAPEPITMLALIPGVAMLVRRKKKN